MKNILRVFLNILIFIYLSNQAVALDQSNYVAVHIWPSSDSGSGHGAMTLVRNDRPFLHISLYPNRDLLLEDNSAQNSNDSGCNSANMVSVATGYFAPDFKELIDYAPEYFPKTVKIYSLNQDKIQHCYESNKNNIRYHLTEGWNKTAFFKAAKDDKAAAAVGGTLAAGSVGGGIAAAVAVGGGAGLAVAATPVVAGLGASAHAWHAIANEHRRQEIRTQSIAGGRFDVNCCSCVDTFLTVGGKQDILDQFMFGDIRYSIHASTSHTVGPPEKRRIDRPLCAEVSALQERIEEKSRQLSGWSKTFWGPIYSLEHHMLEFARPVVNVSETTIGVAKIVTSPEYLSGAVGRSCCPAVALSPGELLSQVETLRSYEKSLLPITESWIDRDDNGEWFSNLVRIANDDHMARMHEEEAKGMAMEDEEEAKRMAMEDEEAEIPSSAYSDQSSHSNHGFSLGSIFDKDA